MKQTLTVLSCFLLLTLLSAGIGAADERLTKPTDDQKRQIQEEMDRSNGPAADADECREKEAAARESWIPAVAEYWAARARHYEAQETALRQNVIDMVDLYYDIDEPPNTTVTYDPNSTDYGYTYGTKDDIRVVLCPEAFEEGPGLVASTKIHELRHAWQIFWCWSDIDDFWEDCTWWFHFTEWDAYDEEERAYDACFTSDMDPEEKELIKERLKEHDKAMDTAVKAEWEENLVPVFPDTAHGVQVLLYNPNEAADDVTLAVSDELGWPVTPALATVPLVAEDFQLVPVTVTVPAGMLPGTVNAVSLSATAYVNPGNPAEDKCYFVVKPTVEVQAGGPVMDWPGATAPVYYYVRNNGATADDFTCEVTSALGWTAGPALQTVSLDPGESAVVLADVSIPPAAPDWAVDALFCTATSDSDPVQTHRDWVAVSVIEQDAAALGSDFPLGPRLPGETVTPTAVVVNNGHIDSFFDVMFEIERMDGTTFWSDLTAVPPLAPGEVSEAVFTPVALLETGDFTTIVTVLLPGDANPDNDLAYGSFSVPAPGTVGCSIATVPAYGVVPFTTQFTVNLDNLYTGQARRMAARIDVTLAGGGFFPNWRAGYTNIAAGGSYPTVWNQGVPALGTLIGDNFFLLLAEDVTPAPYNQPPYPAAGDTCTSEQILTADPP